MQNVGESLTKLIIFAFLLYINITFDHYGSYVFQGKKFMVVINRNYEIYNNYGNYYYYFEKQTHTREREKSSNTKAHHNYTLKP